MSFRYSCRQKTHCFLHRTVGVRAKRPAQELFLHGSVTTAQDVKGRNRQSAAGTPLWCLRPPSLSPVACRSPL